MTSSLSPSASTGSVSLHARQASSPQPPGSFLTFCPPSLGDSIGCDVLRPPLELIWLCGFVGTVVSILALATPLSCSIHDKPSFSPPRELSANLPSRPSSRVSLPSATSASQILFPTFLSRPRQVSLRRHSYTSPYQPASDETRRESDISTLTTSSSFSTPSSRRSSILSSTLQRPSCSKRVSFSSVTDEGTSEGAVRSSSTDSAEGRMLDRAISEEPEAIQPIDGGVEGGKKTGGMIRRLSLTRIAGSLGRKSKGPKLDLKCTVSSSSSFSSPTHDLMLSPTNTNLSLPPSLSPSRSSNRSLPSPTSISFRNPFGRFSSTRTSSSAPCTPQKTARTRPYEDGSIRAPI